MGKFAQSAILVGLLALSAPALAQAQSNPKSDDSTTAEAKRRFAEGISSADAGDHEAARLKFGQAWSLLKSPAILYNLARSEQLSNHPVEALEHYRLFQKMSSDPKVTEQQKQRATENIAELSKKVGQIEVDAPAGAKIAVDGKSIEWSANSDPIPVLVGKHTVESNVDGKTQQVTVDCAAGTVAKAKLNEPPPPVVAPPPPPPAPVSEPPKEEGPGFWTTGRAVGTGLAVVGLGGVATGIVFQLKTGSLRDDASGLRTKIGSSAPGAEGPCVHPSAANQSLCSQLKDKNDSLATSETLRTAFFIGGGALLVGGVVLFLVSSPSKSSAASHAVNVLPWATATDAGVSVFGRF